MRKKRSQMTLQMVLITCHSYEGIVYVDCALAFPDAFYYRRGSIAGGCVPCMVDLFVASAA